MLDPFELIDKAYPTEVALAEDSSETPVSFDKKRNLDSTKATRILFVEDTVFFRKTVKALLEKSGHVVTTAVDGQEAIELLRLHPQDFDLVISDIEMPRMNGFDFAEAIKKNSQLASIPLLAVSSRADSHYKARGMKAGFDLYLEKLKSDELFKAIEQLTKSKKKEAA